MISLSLVCVYGFSGSGHSCTIWHTPPTTLIHTYLYILSTQLHPALVTSSKYAPHLPVSRLMMVLPSSPLHCSTDSSKPSSYCIFSGMHPYIPPDGITLSLPKAHWSIIHAWCLHLFVSRYFSHNCINSSVQRLCSFFILYSFLEKCLIHRRHCTNLYGKELKVFHELLLFPMYISK